jgi:lipopolysaccharide cholinephosphotransferase
MLGFGEQRQEAINILKKTIDILNEFDINHFLISGTLLGYVRHNDFIPWDDDIDLLVDETIFKKLFEISEKYPDINIFKGEKYDCIKFCFQDGIEIPTNPRVEKWKSNSISKSNKYCWPFVDLFIYETGPGLHSCSKECEEDLISNHKVKIFNPNSGDCSEPFRVFSENDISFFHNDWKRSEFFPARKVELLGINCNIPKNPNYFLSINFGKDYMTSFKGPEIIHKTDTLYDN